MLVLDCEQGSPEWFQARLGIPTSSHFSDIVTSTGKASSQAKAYRYKLLAESLGLPPDEYSNAAMDRGVALEEQARTAYEFLTGRRVEQVGFVLRDDRKVGCSPDGLIGDDDGIEIKCPLAHTHIGYLLEQTLPTAYIPQVQGCMWITGRPKWTFFSYHPDLPPLILPVERDEAFMEALDKYIGKFLEDMDREKKSLIASDAPESQDRPETVQQAQEAEIGPWAECEQP